MSVDVAVPELAVTSLPRLLACRPWQAASGSSGNCITVTAGNHRPHIGEQGRVLVFRQQFWWALRFFLREKHYSAQASYFAACRGIRDTKIEQCRGIQDKIYL